MDLIAPTRGAHQVEALTANRNVTAGASARQFGAAWR